MNTNMKMNMIRFEAIKNLKQIIIHRTRTDVLGYTIIMQPLTEEVEKNIDKGLVIALNEINIPLKDILAYGDINFKNDDDLDILDSIDWLDDSFRGDFIPRNYNYKEHCGFSSKGNVELVESFDIERILKYCHGAINKPDKIILYKVQNAKLRH